MESVWISFSLTNEEDETQFEVEGKLSSNYLEFVSPQNELHKITFQDEVIIYEKNGESSMRFSFVANQDSIGTYKILSQIFKFTIHTDILLHDDKCINIEYKLLQSGNLIQDAKLSISYRPI